MDYSKTMKLITQGVNKGYKMWKYTNVYGIYTKTMKTLYCIGYGEHKFATVSKDYYKRELSNITK